jgi:hypothetical protein
MNLRSHSGRASPRIRHFLSLACLAALAACGGGGGGVSVKPFDTPAADSATGGTLSGVASKGLLRNALVTVKQLSASGAVVASTQVRTDDNGAYKVQGLPSSGTVLVEVTADANTRMVDEFSNNTEVLLPSGFKLRGAINLASSSAGADNKLHVTPFSEMAVQRAANSTEGFSAGTIEAANADVAKAFGFNPLTDEPKFEDRGTKPVNAAGLWLAAVSTLANDNTNAKALGCDVSPLVTVGARVNCVVSAMGKQGLSDDSLLNKLDAAKKKAKADEQYAQAEPQPPKAIKTPLVSAAGATGIGNAKAFVASIRNTVPGYKSLQKKVEEVDTLLSSAILPASASQRATLQAVFSVLGELDAYTKGQRGSAPLPVPADELINPEVDEALGAYCTAYQDTNFSAPSTTSANVRAVVCRVAHDRVYDQPNGGFTEYQHQVFFQTTDATGGYLVSSRIVKEKYKAIGVPVDPTFKSTEVVTQALEALPVSLVHDALGRITAANVNGYLAPQVFAADSYGKAHVLVEMAATPVALADGITRINLRGDLQGPASATDANLIAVVGLSPGSFIDARLRKPGDPYSGKAGLNGAGGHLQVEATAYRLSNSAAPNLTEASVTGVVELRNLAVSASGESLPQAATFIGQISKGGNDIKALLFEGRIDGSVGSVAGFDRRLNESTSNVLPGKSITVTGSFFLAPQKPLVLSITVTGDAKVGDYSLTGSYTQGTVDVNFSGFNRESTDQSSLSLSATNGISLTLASKAQRLVDLKANGNVKIGVADLDKGRIDYADGSVESF